MDNFRVLSALSEMYVSLYYYDLNNNTLEAVKSNRFIDTWSAEYEGAKEKTIAVMRNITEQSDLEKMIAFVDTDTLNERMGEKSVISETFHGKINGLCRGSFIVVDRNPDMTLHHVLYAVEVFRM